MSEVGINKLYLYDTKGPKSVLRTSLSEEEGPKWTAENCRAFTEEEFVILVQSLGEQFINYYGPAAQRVKRGWCIVEGEVRDKIILGCLANDIDLEIINWEGK